MLRGAKTNFIGGGYVDLSFFITNCIFEEIALTNRSIGFIYKLNQDTICTKRSMLVSLRFVSTDRFLQNKAREGVQK